MITFVPLAMFATPVFYRVTDLPGPLRALAYANPLGTAIEMVRAAVLEGVFPPTLACCGFLVVSLAVCRGGYAVFERYKGILIDVDPIQRSDVSAWARPINSTPGGPTR